MKNLLKPTFALLFSASVLLSCDKNNPGPMPDGEAITTLTLLMVPVGGGQNVTATFRDSNGDGTADLHDQIVLQSGKTYNVSISVLDESNAAAPVNRTTEIEQEKNEHQFFFTPSANLANKLTITYQDQDENNRPVGLQTQFKTMGVEPAGNLRVTLKHQPNNQKTNTSTIDTGTTDIEVDFVTKIQN